MDFWTIDSSSNYRGLFRRCLNCDPNEIPSCPTCGANEVCNYISPSCTACASTQCLAVGSSKAPSPEPSPRKSSAGPIAGGVVGGLVFVLLITYLVWRFCIKKRREEWHQKYWQDPANNAEKENDEFTMQRDARASTHTVGSIASTVLTRASNIIQIAYIPGVTNRSVESSPDLLVPPVPPIPAASPSHSAVSTPQPHQQDRHFFMPSDLRGSSYSDYTTDDGRTSFARSSMTPSHLRSSVATNAYRGNAVINTAPAQTATRAKAIPISLKSTTTTGTTTPNTAATPRSTTPPIPGVNLPPVPAINLQRNGSSHSPIVARLGIPRAVTVTRNQSSTAMNASNSATGRGNPSPSSSEASQPVLVKPERRVSIADSVRHNGDSSTFDDASSSDEDSPAEQSLMGHEKQLAAARLGHSSFKTPASAPDLRYRPSPSSSPDSRGYAASESRQKRHKRSGSLNQIIEEATRRASREPRHGGLGSVGSLAHWRNPGGGPFSDANAAKTP